MKKLLLYTAGLMIMISTHLSAQTDVTVETNKPRPGTVLLGPVAGFGNSWVGNLPGDIMFKSSGYIGISLIELKNPHWGWGGQLTLSSEGYAINQSGGVQTIK